MSQQDTDGLRLKVSEAEARDAGRGLIRLDPADMTRLKVQPGDIVEITGKRAGVGKVLPVAREKRGQSRLHIDGILRENAGAALDQIVPVRKVQARPADRVVLTPIETTPGDKDLKYIASLLDGLAVVSDDRVRVDLFGTRSVDFKVASTAPNGPVLLHAKTRLDISGADKSKTPDDGRISYEDIGGLKRELGRIREIIELPLRYPEVFERLGIDAPKGVLLYGPPGCGKTLIARAVAHETQARFYSISGPEIIHRYYGDSEAHLRKVFDEATKKAPSIIFLDELDSIAPRREDVHGEVEKRVVAQLLALMDGLSKRENVMVIAATNLPNNLDPALRRPGRFDREISISIPDRDGRKEILAIHSRGMPLAVDVDLDQISGITHGFVGADLQALCREAAMIRLRRILPNIDFAAAEIPYESLAKLEVDMNDFVEALREVEPSAMREVFLEVPEVKWTDIGGLEPIKQQLREAVEWPLRHPGMFTAMKVKPPRGILLSGPPGSGKTLLAKAVATESQVNFLTVKGSQLLSKFVGESEKGVRDVFRKAKQAAPCIVFLDEVDTLLPARTGGGFDSGVGERVMGQFLAEMDGVEDRTGVLVLGATNRADSIDPALLRPGRFDIVIEIPPLDYAGRREIFAIGLRGKPVADDVNLDELTDLAAGFSGAEVQAVCNRAALQAIRERLAHGGQDAEGMRIERRHLIAALEGLRKQNQPSH